MKSYEFIEMFKEKNELPSDYSAAKSLGVSRAAMSNYKNGRPLDEDLALELAESLSINVSDILYIIRSEKAKDDKHKKAWLKLAKMSKEAGKATPNLLILNVIFSLSALQYILCKIAHDKRNQTGVSVYI